MFSARKGRIILGTEMQDKFNVITPEEAIKRVMRFAKAYHDHYGDTSLTLNIQQDENTIIWHQYTREQYELQHKLDA